LATAELRNALGQVGRHGPLGGELAHGGRLTANRHDSQQHQARPGDRPCAARHAWNSHPRL